MAVLSIPAGVNYCACVFVYDTCVHIGASISAKGDSC